MAAWSVQQQIGWRKGPWTPEEDKLLVEYVNLHGEGRWSSVARCAGNIFLQCTLRVFNFGHITVYEKYQVVSLDI